VLFSIWGGDGWQSAVLDLDSRNWSTVLEDGAAARYVPTGHIVYAEMSIAAARPGLFAVPFDTSRQVVDGTPVAVLEAPGLAGPNFVVSPGGTLAYIASGSPAWAGLEENRLVWRGVDGTTTQVSDESGFYEAPRLSPDGTQLSFAGFSPAGSYDTWIYDLERGTSTRVSQRGSINNFPIWMPDGSALTFNSSRSPIGLYTKPLDDSGDAEQLVARRQHIQVPGSWSSDGMTLAFTELDIEAQGDIWTYSADSGAVAWLESPADEKSPSFSPTGSWLAFTSNESGRNEIYLRPYPGPGAAVPMSVNGGVEPVWAPDGRTLFYRQGLRVLAVTLADGTPATASQPRPLFEGPYQAGTFGHPNYDVAADGRFVMVEPLDEPTPTLVNVVLNWFTQLESLVPTR
jgi:serine/threonine-protein kinase